MSASAATGAGEDWQHVDLAVALTGGVSLAVWMGGVATEIQHLVRGDGAYGTLAQLTRTRTAVDVIGGSSAGGINGACLAIALSHGTDMSALRDLWVEQGSLELLLRAADDPSTVSLLRGDEYFLPHIRAALDSLRGAPDDPAKNPVELIITGTLLRGRRQRCTDDFGSVFTDVAHKAQFRFRRGPEHPVDDFARADIAARLALAARCTSSFPGAFEASWCPIGVAEGPDRPDMADHADFADSSWVIDGGVLVNKPLAPVLATLASHPGEPAGRRVVLFVQPAPDGSGVDQGGVDQVEQIAPGFAAVLGSGMLAIPHAESLSQDLTVIEQHNARVTRRTQRRESLLYADTQWTRQAAEQLLSSYLRTKADAVLFAVADHLSAASRRSAATIAALAQLRSEIDAAEKLQQLPVTPEDLERWHWSTSEVAETERLIAHVLQLASELPEPRTQASAALTTARASLDDVRARLHRLQRQEAWARLDHALHLMRGKAGPATDTGAAQAACAQLHAELAQTLAAVVPALRSSALDALEQPTGQATGADRDRNPHSLLSLTGPGGPLAPGTEPSTLRCWLLHLAVVISGEHIHQHATSTLWELLHVSAEAPNAFDGRVHPGDKLAGLQLQHFGAFHKSSWRANDWLWGRLDAASRLVQLQLSPARIRRLVLTDPQLVNEFVERIGDLAIDADLAGRVDPDKLRQELMALSEADQQLPASLPACTAAVLAAVQAQILREELPYVATRVTADERDGHTPQPGGAALVDRCQRLARQDSGKALVEAFLACRLGEERISDDAGSLVYRRTVDRVTALAVRLGHPSPVRRHGSTSARLRVWSASPMVLAVHRLTLQSRALLMIVTALVIVGDALLLATLDPRPGLVAASAVGCAILAVAVALAGFRVGRGGQLVAAMVGLSLAGRVVFGIAHTGPLWWRLWVSVMAALALAAAAHIRVPPRLRILRRVQVRNAATSRQLAEVHDQT